MTLVDKALEVLEAVLDAEEIPVGRQGTVVLKLQAAAHILRFAAGLPAQQPAGCQHEKRVDMTTMGGPTIEVCATCGARIVNGVEE